MAKPTLTRDILLAALAGFQLDKQRIDAQIAEVQAMLDGGGRTRRWLWHQFPRKYPKGKTQEECCGS